MRVAHEIAATEKHKSERFLRFRINGINMPGLVSQQYRTEIGPNDIFVETGCRPGELLSLLRKNVNLKAGFIFIPKGKTRNARRKIPLTSKAKDVLTWRIASCKSDFVFENEQTGSHIKSVKTAHWGALKRCGIEHFRLYDLRHTFASRFAEAGGTLIVLKEILGHADLKMVLRYAHPGEEHRFSATCSTGANDYCDDAKTTISFARKRGISVSRN